MARSSLLAVALVVALLRGVPAADYPASKHGGTYMFNYYLPPAPSSTPWWPAWAPDGRVLAFAQQGSIWTVDLSTRVAREITRGATYHSSPAWSPDGRWIAYTADDGGGAIALEIVEVASGTTARLTNDTHLYADPVFSPDGTHLAYVSSRPNGYFNVYIRPIRDGRFAGEEIAVTRDHGFGRDRPYMGAWDMHLEPAWMPDGRELVLLSNRGVPLGSGHLWRVPAEAGGMERARLVLAEETLYRTRPDVSRDGKRIIFSSTRGAADEYSHLYLVSASGGEPYKLTFGSHDDFHPRFSPDGEWIAYISNDGGLADLWLLETYGGARKRVAVAERRWLRPMGKVTVRVLDAGTGKPTAARIYAPAADGKLYAPLDAYARVSSTRMTHRLDEPFFHAEGQFTLAVPPGRMKLAAFKGFEYWPAEREVEVREGGESNVTLELRPMIDMAARGWRSGSTHSHMNYGGNLRNTLAHMARMGRAEDLDVVNVLVANKDSRILDWEHFATGGGAHPASPRDPIVIVGEEYRPPFWGHVFFIGLRDHLISPFTAGYLGTALESLYPSNTDMFRKALLQDAAAGYVHAFGGERDPLDGGLGGAKSFPVDAALGTVHALEWSSSARASFTVWAHARNNDLPIAPVGGEDANTSLHRHTVIGSVRTYVHTGAALTAQTWIRGIKEGKTIATTGPLVELTVEGKGPGESVRLPANGGTLRVEARVWSWLPLESARIYRNGSVVKEIPLAADRKSASFAGQLEATSSGWYSLVAEGPAERRESGWMYPQAVTGAVRVYVGEQKIRSRASAEYFVRWIERLRAQVEAWPAWGSDAEKTHVLGQLAQARAVYEKLGLEAGAR